MRTVGSRAITALMLSASVTAGALLAAAGAGAAARIDVARSTATCTAAGLDIWLNTAGNGTAGSIYYQLNFTNLSKSTCSLAGYPGVSAVSLAGKQLGAAAGRDAVHAPATVTLKAGATAKTFVQITIAGVYPASRCAATTAAGLRVYAPGATHSVVDYFPFPACSSGNAVYLHVEPLQAAAGVT